MVISRESSSVKRRVTIADIALRAGVSKGAVSYALNDRPGISEATRRRILDIADDLGWYPNSAARALSGARAGACGLVLARPARTLAFEPFFMELIAGIEAELSSRSIGLTLQVVEDVEAEMAVYRREAVRQQLTGSLRSALGHVVGDEHPGRQRQLLHRREKCRRADLGVVEA